MKLINCVYYHDEEKKIVKGAIEIENDKIKEKLIDDIIEEKDLLNYFSRNIENLDTEQLDFNYDGVLDCKNHLVIPAGIDPHVHFDTPGYTHREDFAHGTASAAAGGITHIIDMPCTSIPEVINKENFNKKLDIVSKMAHIDFSFFGGIHGNMIDENLEKNVKDLVELKVKGFKVYTISGMKTFPRVTNFQLYKILNVLKKYNIPVLIHAEDFELVTGLTEEEKTKGNSFINYFNSRPALAEILAIQTVCEIAKNVKGNLHIVHVASYDAALKIKEFKKINDVIKTKEIKKIENINKLKFNENKIYKNIFKNKIPENKVPEKDGIEDIKNNNLYPLITCETCPQYIYFTYQDFEIKGSSLKTAPVVKTEYDKNGLKKLLFEGSIDFITSDHAPAPIHEKNTGSAWTDYGGIPGTQTIIPVLLTIGFSKKQITLKKLIEITSENAAKRYQLYPEKGSLKNKTYADIAVINPVEEWVFKKDYLLSKGETTPFDGEKFKGKVKITINRGKIIYTDKNGVISFKGYGKYY